MQNFARDYPAALGEGAYQICQSTNEVVMQITPHRTGHLSRNNKVSEPEVRPGRVALSMYNPVEYAQYVHENLNAQHAPGTQAKFMEAPIMRDLPIWPKMMLRVAEDLIAKEAGRRG